MDQVVADYVTANSPISPAIQGRIVLHGHERGDRSELSGPETRSN